MSPANMVFQKDKGSRLEYGFINEFLKTIRTMMQCPSQPPMRTSRLRWPMKMHMDTVQCFAWTRPGRHLRCVAGNIELASIVSILLKQNDSPFV
jgi:hypothetical protein